MWWVTSSIGREGAASREKTRGISHPSSSPRARPHTRAFRARPARLRAPLTRSLALPTSKQTVRSLTPSSSRPRPRRSATEFSRPNSRPSPRTYPSTDRRTERSRVRALRPPRSASHHADSSGRLRVSWICAPLTVAPRTLTALALAERLRSGQSVVVGSARGLLAHCCYGASRRCDLEARRQEAGVSVFNGMFPVQAGQGGGRPRVSRPETMGARRAEFAAHHVCGR